MFVIFVYKCCCFKRKRKKSVLVSKTVEFALSSYSSSKYFSIIARAELE
jgi:hypothetical protein